MLWLWMLACNPVENPLPCESEGQDRITLPADDAVHQEDTEWWTWSGHLSDENGSWYGFQLGFFLFGTGQTRSVRANAAVTDIDGQLGPDLYEGRGDNLRIARLVLTQLRH